ncbi:MAG TPA: hypothetical protein VD947_00865, partial [Patescibacteria group bacterium]|nr:hypothetical protein [Patescibacteria group bacterium]
ELLSAINGLDHANAHDALSDVSATIAFARLIKEKQPKLFDYLLNLRTKKAVQSLVESNDIFIYSSGKYPGEYEKTAVVSRICPHPDKNGVLVYDLRHDPTEYIDMSPEQLVERWKYDKERKEPRLPVKALQYNRCPAIAPLSVLDKGSEKRLDINLDEVKKYQKILQDSDSFKNNLLKAIGIINSGRKEQTQLIGSYVDAETMLYDGFIPDSDKDLSSQLRAAKPEDISSFTDKFSDERLKNLVLPYKARNFSKFLSDEERAKWEEHRIQLLLGGKESSMLAKFMTRLQEVSAREGLSADQQYLLEELRLWAENIVPVPDN